MLINSNPGGSFVFYDETHMTTNHEINQKKLVWKLSTCHNI